MGIKTVRHPPYSLDLAPRYFCLFPKVRGRRYETIEEMKEAVTKVIDTLTDEDFHGAFQKVFERYNKCIAAEGDFIESDKSFMCVLPIKVPIRKNSVNLFNDPCISLKTHHAPSSIYCTKILPVDILDYEFVVVLMRDVTSIYSN